MSKKTMNYFKVIFGPVSLLMFALLALTSNISSSSSLKSSKSYHKFNSVRKNKFHKYVSINNCFNRTNDLRKKRDSSMNYPWDYFDGGDGLTANGYGKGVVTGTSTIGYNSRYSTNMNNDNSYINSNFINNHHLASTNLNNNNNYNNHHHPHHHGTTVAPYSNSVASGPLGLIGPIGGAFNQLAHSNPFQTNRLDFAPNPIVHGHTPVFLVSHKNHGITSWIVPFLMMLALPFITGAAFIPLFLKSIVYLLQIGRNLGILFPLIPPVINGTNVG